MKCQEDQVFKKVITFEAVITIIITMRFNGLT